MLALADARPQKRELGPYAFETRMPDRIARMIETESSQNKFTGVITAMAAALEADREVEGAYLCHQFVVQIFKLRGEGNHFCTYRNMQMLLPDPHPIYSISKMQGMIEKAWDQGINSHGRIETGGIRSTRKHIGTSEVCYFHHLVNYFSSFCRSRPFLAPSAYRARPPFLLQKMRGESF